MTEPLTPSEALARKLDTLPDGPGVYLWKDAAGEVLYVGKAKRLRSRVRSYFASDFAASPEDRACCVRLIADVETIVVADEAQSLLLENNLIKEYQPRFNVRLKDDKSYPSIAVTLGGAVSRACSSRAAATSHGARYFGPYTDVGASCAARSRIVRRIFTVRSCSDDLPGERRERPCLDYHIGRCKAPCVGWQSEADYRAMIDDVVGLPRGPHRRRAARRCARRCWRRASGEDYERATRPARRAEVARAARGAASVEVDRAPATPTSSATRATATTRSACSCASAMGE